MSKEVEDAMALRKKSAKQDHDDITLGDMLGTALLQSLRFNNTQTKVIMEKTFDLGDLIAELHKPKLTTEVATFVLCKVALSACDHAEVRRILIALKEGFNV